jgi:hypothetical protein
MRLAFLALLFVLSSLVSCKTPQSSSARGIQAAPSAKHLRSPVCLRDAILTLPAAGIAGMSPQGRKDYLASRPGVFNESSRRIELFNDNPYEGGDARSMLYLRLFEDEAGHTIAASHAARPFADFHDEPSATHTRVYRFTDGAWQEITDPAFAASIPREAYFRFDGTGAAVGYGFYRRKLRRDGRGDFYDFGPQVGRIVWQDGAFRMKP